MVAHFHLYYSILYIAELIREALENTEEGVKVGGKLVKALKFADDQAMLAGSEYDLQRMMDRLNMVSVNYNMKINTKKTKVMKISKGTESTMKIVVAEEIIEQIKEFRYLGNLISDDASLPQRNQEKDSNGKRSLFQEERTSKRRIEKMS